VVVEGGGAEDGRKLINREGLEGLFVVNFYISTPHLARKPTPTLAHPVPCFAWFPSPWAAAPPRGTLLQRVNPRAN
jgi:hypothetical protein